MPVEGRFPAVEETFTITPPPRSRMPGTAARIERTKLITFSCQASSHCSSVSSRKSRCSAYPTLLTSTSSAPASATTRSASPGRERSARTCSSSPTPGASLRPHVTTRAPSATSSRAVASPIPPVEPVTRQRRSRRPRSTGEYSSAAVTTILLARHGETDWNREGRFQGHADPPLNRTGRDQAVELSVALMAEDLAAVYSSPLQRALETAEIVAASRGLEPVTVAALREVDVGS